MRGIDAIQQYILDHTEILPTDKVYQLAMDCFNHSDIDLVKLGFILIELFSEPEESVKDMMHCIFVRCQAVFFVEIINILL